MILTDKQIRERCLGPERMIEPFSEAVSGGGRISWGLTHSGYDLRLGPKVALYRNTHCEPIDPKKFADDAYRRRVFDEFEVTEAGALGGPQFPHWNRLLIPPNGYILACTLEYVRMPRDLKGHVVGKSTLARTALLVNTTPIEPGWHGHITLELSNPTNSALALYVNEGVAQLEFFRLDGLPETDYEMKGGLYQGQTGLTPARVRA
jgi:dCTP deaminase